MNTLIWVSSLGLLSLTVYTAVRRRDWRSLPWALLALGSILALLIWAGLLRPPQQEQIAPRGGEEQGLLILVLYGAMLAGMLSHYLYLRFERPRSRRRKFDLGSFLAPVFVSPIVFLPLASVFESVEPGLAAADASRLILLLVAFENGFFWREFFENRQKARAAGGEE